MSRNTIATVVVALAFAAMSDPAAGAEAADVAEPAEALSRDINKFSVDLYKKLIAEDKNALFSPLSISTAFGLAQQGAAGKTSEEMREALRLSVPRDQLAGAYAQLLNSLNEREADNAFKLHNANAIWVLKDYPIKEAFAEVAKTSFAAKAEHLPFQSQPQQSAERINSWIAEQTAGKITDLIPASAINDLTRLILTNAVYFKGTWQSQFKKPATSPRKFHQLKGEAVEVPTMHQTAQFRYTENEAVQVLEMRYKKCDLAMLILLPKTKDGLPALEMTLSEEQIRSLIKKLKPRRLEVAMPKFKLETKYGLSEAMQAMGMNRAFTPGAADFSGITDKEELFISAAVHKAYVDVDEEGTEAAAATGLMMQTTSALVAPPTQFIADHPFIFMIRDTRAEVILFIGRLLDPRD